MIVRFGRSSDLGLLYEWFSDPEDAALAQPHRWSSPEDFTAEYQYVIQSDRHSCYVLERQGEMAAWLEYRGLMPEPGEPSVTLWTNRLFRPGIGAHALASVLDIGFLHLGVPKLWWRISMTNLPMLRLCEAFGLRCLRQERTEEDLHTEEGEVGFGFSRVDYLKLSENSLYRRSSTQELQWED